MARQTLVFDNFQGGDTGRKGLFNAPKNAYSATNLLLYRTGELGVRSGFREVTPSGVATGAVLMLAEWGNKVYYIQDTALRYFTPSSTASSVTTLANSFTGTPSLPSYDNGQADFLFIATNNAGAYKADGGTLTALTSSPNGTSIARYGTRLVIAKSTLGTIEYSADNVFTTWGNTIIVDNDTITALKNQRNGLTIMFSNSIWVLNGTLSVNESVRRVSRTRGAVDHLAAWVNEFDSLYYAGSVATGQGDTAPIRFDGAYPKRLDNQIIMPAYASGSNTRVSGISSNHPEGVAFFYPNQAAGDLDDAWFLIYMNGVWTKHRTTLGLDMGLCTVRLPFFQDSGSTSSELRYGATLVSSDGGAVGVAPKFYGLVLDMDRPGSETVVDTGQAPERAGDASAEAVEGEVTFPEWHADPGYEVRVRDVIVDFRAWDTGASNTNHFDITVAALRTYDNGPVESITQEWDEDPSYSEPSGTQKRVTFSLGDQGSGNAFQVSLSSMRGIALVRYFVVVEVTPIRI